MVQLRSLAVISLLVAVGLFTFMASSVSVEGAETKPQTMKQTPLQRLRQKKAQEGHQGHPHLRYRESLSLEERYRNHAKIHEHRTGRLYEKKMEQFKESNVLSEQFFNSFKKDTLPAKKNPRFRRAVVVEVMAEERKDKGMGAEGGHGEGHGHGHGQSHGLPFPLPFTLGPTIKYTQTYYNPFTYGGPNGPPTFVPALGVWPSYNQNDGY